MVESFMVMVSRFERVSPRGGKGSLILGEEERNE